jgi:cytochrome P450
LPFVIAFDHAQRQISEMIINPVLSLRNRYFGGRYRNDVKTIREFGLDVIKERRSQANGNKDRKDLLSLFMEFTNNEGNPLTDEQLVDQVINFIIAGRDTTAQALSWTFYDLATRPEIAEKICQEAKSIMGDSLIPTYDQVREMKYAKAVFLESLRLHPSVRRDGKEALNDDVLPNGTVIKKGTFVVWNNYAMGRNENIWKDASTYNPDRFMEGKTYSQFEYPAFNAGPRVCLGKTLAELQGVFAMVCILVQFKISPVDLTGVDFLFSLTNPMKSGLWSKVEVRSEV